MVWTKFAEGAWLVTVAIPVLVACFLGINRHYRRFARRLSAGVGAVQAARVPTNEVLLAVESIDVATEGALWYARQIAGDGDAAGAAHAGQAHGSRDQAALVGLRAGAASAGAARDGEGATQALLEEVWRLPRGESDFVTVIVPEQFRRPSLSSAARRSSFRLKLRLLAEPGVVVTDVPAVTARRTRRATRPSSSLFGC